MQNVSLFLNPTIHCRTLCTAVWCLQTGSEGLFVSPCMHHLQEEHMHSLAKKLNRDRTRSFRDGDYLWRDSNGPDDYGGLLVCLGWPRDFSPARSQGDTQTNTPGPYPIRLGPVQTR